MEAAKSRSRIWRKAGRGRRGENATAKRINTRFAANFCGERKFQGTAKITVPTKPGNTKNLQIVYRAINDAIGP
jgi:hypothetical protein